jgi:hypothetical protein
MAAGTADGLTTTEITAIDETTAITMRAMNRRCIPIIEEVTAMRNTAMATVAKEKMVTVEAAMAVIMVEVDTMAEADTMAVVVMAEAVIMAVVVMAVEAVMAAEVMAVEAMAVEVMAAEVMAAVVTAVEVHHHPLQCAQLLQHQ